MEGLLLSVKEAANVIGVSPYMVREMCMRKELVGKRLSIGKRTTWYVYRWSIERLLGEQIVRSFAGYDLNTAALRYFNERQEAFEFLSKPQCPYIIDLDTGLIYTTEEKSVSREIKTSIDLWHTEQDRFQREELYD